MISALIEVMFNFLYFVSLIISMLSTTSFAYSRLACGQLGVEPAEIIGYLEPVGLIVTDYGNGTAFLISPTVAVTAAHNVQRRTGEISKNIWFFSASKAIASGKTLNAKDGVNGSIVTVGNYTENPISEDWACVKLEKPIKGVSHFSKPAHFPYIRGDLIHTAGFPDVCKTPEKNNLTIFSCRTDVAVNLNFHEKTNLNISQIDMSGVETFFGCNSNPGLSGAAAYNINNEVVGVMTIGSKPGERISTGAFVNVSKFQKCFEFAARTKSFSRESIPPPNFRNGGI